MSLAVIVGTLFVTVVLSLLSPKGKALTTIKNARRHATQYLDLDYEADPTIREQNYRHLLEEENALNAFDEKSRHLIHDEQHLLDLLDEAHRVHDHYVSSKPEHFPQGDPTASHRRFPTADFRRTTAEEEAHSTE